MDKKELTLDEIHSETLIILKKIIDICEIIGVNYYVAFGTLIGAVRHKGFIPWDDDLDIVMLRPEYDRFCDYCTTHMDELTPFKLLTRETTKGYPYNIARFNNLSFIAEYDNVKSYESGVFVDIYPLDGAGNSDIIPDLENKKSKLFRYISWSIQEHFEKSSYNKWYRSLLKYPAWKYVQLRGMDYYLSKMDLFKNLYDFNDSKYISEMVWDPEVVLLEKDWFDSYILMDFEDLKVKVPSGYREFLEVYYGKNYMTLPPVEARVPQHGYKIFRK